MGVSASTLSPAAAAHRATSGLPLPEGAVRAGARRRGRTVRRAGRSGAVDREASEMTEHADLDMAAGSIVGEEERRGGEQEGRGAEARAVLKLKQGRQGDADTYEAVRWPRSEEGSQPGFGNFSPLWIRGKLQNFLRTSRDPRALHGAGRWKCNRCI